MPASYWDVEGDFTPDGTRQPSSRHRAVSAVDGARVATGRDFADDGTLKSKTRRPPRRGQTANAIARQVISAPGQGHQRPGEALHAAARPRRSRRATLQQEASRKLRLSSKNAMRVAQRLYENGYITYMRTDSTTLSEAALTAARQQARDLYGGEYVPDAPRRYEKKVKNAQEAHEAIRPAGDRFRTPAQVAGELRGDEFALYELIWKRTVASQMADARGSTATVKLGGTLEDGRVVEFSASRHRHHLPRVPRGLRGGPRRGADQPRPGGRRGAPPAQAQRGRARSPRCAPTPTATRPRRRRATPRRRW